MGLQGDYAAFLNSIGPTAQANRANFGSTDYARLGGTIALQDGLYTAAAPHRRNVFMHWDDMMAFLDWAGLRPYTELEYTKACRDPLEPIPLEYPWNTGSADTILRRVDPLTHARRNPFDRIAFRNYGAWSGGPRNAAYGTRGAHSSTAGGALAAGAGQ